MKWNNKIIPYRHDLKERARFLRNNSTKAEILLWMEIKNRKLGVQFHRQVPILNFIVDFYCHEIKLAIELDGTSHIEPGVPDYDRYRQKELEDSGITVIRFDDELIEMEMEDVVKAIRNTVVYLTPP